jgi:AAA domain
MRMAQFTRASGVRAEPVQWLIPGRVPLGGVSLLAGDPKLGKSALTCLFGAQVSRGVHGHAPAIAAFCSAEDALAQVIKPRLHAAGADLDLVGALSIRDDAGERGMQLPDAVDKLDKFVVDTGARLLVIDPLNAFLSGAIDPWKDHGIRAALAPLARLAEAHGIAVVIVVHLNKQQGGNPLYRPGGSIGYVGAGRSLLAFGRDPDDPDGELGSRRLLGHLGGNWGVLAPTQVYELEGVTVELDGHVIETVRLRYVEEVDVPASAAFGSRPADERGDDAEDAIGERLGDLQPHPSREVKTAVMAELGISARTVERAAVRMVGRAELVITRQGQPPSTVWQLVAPVATNPITRGVATGVATEEPQCLRQIPSCDTDGNGVVATGIMREPTCLHPRAPRLRLGAASGRSLDLWHLPSAGRIARRDAPATPRGAMTRQVRTRRQPSPLMARYKGRPEQRAAIAANVEAYNRLKRTAHRPPTYAPPPLARDSHEVGLMLAQLEGAMRALDHIDGLQFQRGGPWIPRCFCADGGAAATDDARCSRCWGWPR